MEEEKKLFLIHQIGTFSWVFPLVSLNIILFTQFYCRLACSCFAGVMSGLTIGILSINMLDLEIKTVVGTQEEVRQAKVVMNIL